MSDETKLETESIKAEPFGQTRMSEKSVVLAADFFKCRACARIIRAGIMLILVLYTLLTFCSILCVNASDIIQLTNNNYNDNYPQIDNGMVLWQGYDGFHFEFFFFNGTTITQLIDEAYNDGRSNKQITNNFHDDIWPQIENGMISWVESVNNSYVVYVLFENHTVQVTDYITQNYFWDHHVYDGMVTWMSAKGENWGDYTDYEIFLQYGTTTIQLTDNDYIDISPRIGNGIVVWQEYDGNDYEIFLYNGTTIIQLTDNEHDDMFPQIDNGMVAWQGFGNNSGVFLYNGTSTIQLTNDTYNMYNFVIDNGMVAWEGWDGDDFEIFLYNGTNTIQITDNDYDDMPPQIDNGMVAWTGTDGHDYEVFLYDGTTIIQLTDNPLHKDPRPKIDNGIVVWQGYDGHDNEIFLYNGLTTIQITNNEHDDNDPQIDNGMVLWQGYDGHDWEIFVFNVTPTIYKFGPEFKFLFYPQIDNGTMIWIAYDNDDLEVFFFDGASIKQLTNNSYVETYPTIGDGIAAWVGHDGNDYEIFLYNGTTIIQLTDNEHDDSYPQIDNGMVAWAGWDGFDYEVFLYNGTSTIQLTNGTYYMYRFVIDNGMVAWDGYDGFDYEIFLYNGTNTIQITDNDYDNFGPQIDNGMVAWTGTDGHDYEVFLYDGTTIIQLTDNPLHKDPRPKIDNGIVVWQGYDGHDNEIFLYNGLTTIQITNNEHDDNYPQIDNGMITWYMSDGHDDEIFLCSVHPMGINTNYIGEHRFEFKYGFNIKSEPLHTGVDDFNYYYDYTIGEANLHKTLQDKYFSAYIHENTWPWALDGIFTEKKMSDSYINSIQEYQPIYSGKLRPYKFTTAGIIWYYAWWDIFRIGPPIEGYYNQQLFTLYPNYEAVNVWFDEKRENWGPTQEGFLRAGEYRLCIIHHVTYRTVNNPPKALSIDSPNLFDGNMEPTFIGSGTDPEGDGIIFEWDFDFDGVNFDVDASSEVINPPNPIHQVSFYYNSPGTYIVAMRTRDYFDTIGLDDAKSSLITREIKLTNKKPEPKPPEFVIPEYPLGTLTSLGALIASLILYKRRVK